MIASIVSRAIAILFLSIPAGYVCYEFDQNDWQAIQKYSHDELLVYLESTLIHSYSMAIAIVFLVASGTVACVEALAIVLRRFLFQAEVPSAS